MSFEAKFELVFKREIPELQSIAYFYRHGKTGAEILSLANDDENKVFGISFRTPPADSTGVAHILEHSVLCGSRKYPVKEPFVELVKGSLKTFLNAFTYPDKTCYPVASQNVQDFYNLIDVYLDAVFFPRITHPVFQQEGWHYEMDSPAGPLSIKGVVYNEMKGVYSSPDSVLAELSQQSLFPDITYGLDSGGNPEVIPALTYDGFKAFHERYYHPSNARIFFFGNDDPEHRLQILEEYLDAFDRIAPGSEVGLQSVKAAPARIVREFAAGGDGEAPEDLKGMITVNWLLPEVTRPDLGLAFQILEYVLLGMPGSPLKKALIDSGLGTDIAGTGLETELRQMFFSTGLKGIRGEDAEKVENLIFETLSDLSREGIDRDSVEAGVNTVEFRLRENNYGNFPRGLVIMLRALAVWLHDSDPTELIAFEGPLARVKEKLASGGYFEDLIRRHFLENPHRSVVILKPERGLSEKQRLAEEEKFRKIRDTFSDDLVSETVKNTGYLKDLQSAPDSREALATIPVLRVSDLDRTNKSIPVEPGPVESVSGYYHDIFTSGITYLDLGLNLRLLPQQYLPYAPLFGRALLEMGTDARDYVSLSRMISRKTGGIYPDVFTSSVKGGGEPATWMFLRGKSMVGSTFELTNILAEVLGSVKLDNRERFRQIVLEEKAKLEAKMVPSGHQMVNQRIRAHFNLADWARELTGGISYFQFLRRLAGEIDESWTRVLSDLEEVRKLLVNRSVMVFNLTVDRQNLHAVEPALRSLIDGLPRNTAIPMQWTPEPFARFEGIVVPSQVNFVGKGGDIYSAGYSFDGSFQVIAGYLRTSWLWEKVRVQGGAYGGFCLFDRLSGIFTFLSYRDPNLLKTVENFDGTAQFLKTADLDESEIAKAIIGAVGDLDAYRLPDAKGYISLLRCLTNDTEEERQRMREQILGTTVEDFRAFANVLDGLGRGGIVKVIGSEAAINSALSERSGWLETFRLI
ncbi:MAG: insulinase family protein [Desulfobacteraceae bacterium]|nr:insulinase family protein [Desulfobacteraceae bacterium]